MKFSILRTATSSSIRPFTTPPATGQLNITIAADTGLPGANVGDTFAVGLGNVADADGPLALSLSVFTFAWEFEATLGAGDWEPVTDPVTGDPIFGPTLHADAGL